MSHQDYATDAEFVKHAEIFFDQIRKDNWQTYNVDIAKAVSTNFSILISVLSSKHKYLQKEGRLINHPQHGDGWVPLKSEDLEEMTGLTRDEQDGAYEKQKPHGIIEKKLMGLPGVRHYRINKLKLYECIIKFKSASLRKFPKQDSEPESNAPQDNPVCGNSPNSFAEIPQPSHITIPSSSPSDDDRAGATIEKVIIRNSKGIETVVTKEEVHQSAIAEGWSTDAVPSLWEKLCLADFPITNWVRFLNTCWINMKNSFQTSNTKQFKPPKKSSSSPKVEPPKRQYPSDEEIAERQKRNQEIFRAAGLC